MKKPLVLLILDGFGYRTQSKHNAIILADTPHWDHWWATSPHTLLDASGPSVGLPEGQMGNSEVGHMHIGAGRTMIQDLSRIDAAIQTHEFFNNPVLLKLMKAVKKNHKTLHIMGLLSSGGVHSHENHLFALLTLAKRLHCQKIALHLFLDGRDTPPQSALKSLKKLETLIQNTPIQIASLTGRYFAMDRDKRWERILPVYELLLEKKASHQAQDAITALHHAYQKNITDEFLPPTKIGDGIAIQAGDSVLFFNFRADRARALTEALIAPNFNGFERKQLVNIQHFVTFTDLGLHLPTTTVFPAKDLHHTFGEVLSSHGLSQLRIAETEKYAHVTFFFNGGIEKPWPKEKRILIPSPKVATYDLQPEMNAPAITKEILACLTTQKTDVIIANFANADMVGHTGNEAATIRAIQCLDRCMNVIFKAIMEQHGILAITADHGNAECMFDEKTNQPHTAHTSEKVPFLFPGQSFKFLSQGGTLSDIAPTLLHLIGLPIPKEMTGKNLICLS